MRPSDFFWGVAIASVFAALHALRPPRDVSALPEPSDAVKALLRSGNRIAAIRAYRRQSGASLLEANRVIARHAA